jgi:glycosyltransferase involved in cell wall biosynthesis
MLVEGRAVDRQRPTVSIGLPVWNGSRYLGEAIESILAQTFTDFELIVSDNASTDDTAEIIQRYAALDSRVRYHRNDRNIGGARNENLTFEMSTGRYFRLAAYDDILEPTLIERCVDVLERSPETVLSFPQTLVIDDEGEITHIEIITAGTAERPSARFRELAFRDYQVDAAYGLIRSETLKDSILQDNYPDSDRVFLCELGLRGRFEVIHEPLFRRRLHYRNMFVDPRARMAWFEPDEKGRVRFPHWLALAGLVRVVSRARLERKEQIRCVGVLVLWAIKFARPLVNDVIVGVRWRLGNRPDEDGIAYNWETDT